MVLKFGLMWWCTWFKSNHFTWIIHTCNAVQSNFHGGLPSPILVVNILRKGIKLLMTKLISLFSICSCSIVYSIWTPINFPTVLESFEVWIFLAPLILFIFLDLLALCFQLGHVESHGCECLEDDSWIDWRVFIIIQILNEIV